MDLKIFEKMEGLAGDNKELTSLIAQAKTDAENVVILKDKAVSAEQKFRTHKQNINKLFDVEADKSLDDSLNDITTKVSELNTSLDGFKQGASSSENDLAEMRTTLKTALDEVSTIKNQLTEEKTASTRATKESTFREQLNANGITDPSAQNLAINSSMTKLMETDDIESFAKTFAEDNKILTQSGHVPGSGGTGGSAGSPANNEIKYGMSVAEEAAILDAQIAEGS